MLGMGSPVRIDVVIERENPFLLDGKIAENRNPVEHPNPLRRYSSHRTARGALWSDTPARFTAFVKQ